MMIRLEDEVIKGESEKAESIISTDSITQQKAESGDKNLTVLRSYGLTVLKTNQDSFRDSWHTMFEQVFASVPTIYFPLKETLPEIENNIIKITVKNDIQKEHFEVKIREVLAYLRTHFDEQIEDVVVVTNEKMETKKIIYDTKDKLQNFKEQNEEFEDFLQILELQIKD
jgi:hypothetical protein